WGSPDSLIQRDNPFLHVSNFSDQRVVISAGEVLAKSFNPRNWLNRRPRNEETRRQQERHALFLRQVIEQKRVTEIGPRSETRSHVIQSTSDVTSKAQRNATEPNDPASVGPIKGGPKTADTPPEPTPSNDFSTAVNLSPNLSVDQRASLLQILDRNCLAFGLE
ncbi:hypothetical protein CPB85DRAFT_1180022, partial [Mucidula mucida]